MGCRAAETKWFEMQLITVNRRRAHRCSGAGVENDPPALLHRCGVCTQLATAFRHAGVATPAGRQPPGLPRRLDDTRYPTLDPGNAFGAVLSAASLTSSSMASRITTRYPPRDRAPLPAAR